MLTSMLLNGVTHFTPWRMMAVETWPRIGLVDIILLRLLDSFGLYAGRSTLFRLLFPVFFGHCGYPDMVYRVINLWQIVL